MKQSFLVIHTHALWLCGTVTFLAGLSVGFTLAVLLVAK